MKFSPVLYNYITKHFILHFILFICILAGTVFIVDLLEILRRSFGKDVPFHAIVSIVGYKLPYLIQNILPFAVIISTSTCYSHLNKTNELIAARSLGFSAWSFIFPSIVISFFIGIFIVTLFNPFVTIAFKKHISKENKYLKGQSNIISMSDEGIWLKDMDRENKISKIIYAKTLYDKGKYLSEVSIFIIDNGYNFSKRIEADVAIIEKNQIFLEDVKIFEPGQQVLKLKKDVLYTNIVLEQFQDSVSFVEMVSTWQLPAFIKQIEISGFSTIKHRLYFYNLLLLPLFLASLVILTSSFCMSMPRRGKISFMLVVGIGISFLSYFLSRVIYTLGLSGHINIITASIFPILFCLFSGGYLILHYEDG